MKLRTFILEITCGAGILFSAVLFPSVAFAALDLISFHTNPDTPGPEQAVTVSIQSYAVDLDAAMLTWYVDKNIIASGIGEKSIQTTTKEFGQTTTINVVITTASGARYDKQFLIKPAEVDILWEADTSVPPFYKGKALPTYKSIVKLNAIPRFNTLASDPSRYAYAWTANQIQGLAMVPGKNSTLVGMKYAGSAVPITVKVTNYGVGGENTTITGAQKILAVEPLLLFYEDAPLMGIRFDQALSGSRITNGTSFTLRAVPYFFSGDDLANANLVYEWRKDVQQLTPGLDPNVIVLGKEGTGAQSSTIQLSVTNRKRILQSANAGVTINFTAEQ